MYSLSVKLYVVYCSCLINDKCGKRSKKQVFLGVRNNFVERLLRCSLFSPLFVSQDLDNLGLKASDGTLKDYYTVLCVHLQQ